MPADPKTAGGWTLVGLILDYPGFAKDEVAIRLRAPGGIDYGQAQAAASAPSLVEALERIVDNSHDPWARGIARAALAAARGEKGEGRREKGEGG